MQPCVVVCRNKPVELFVVGCPLHRPTARLHTSPWGAIPVHVENETVRVWRNPLGPSALVLSYLPLADCCAFSGGPLVRARRDAGLVRYLETSS